MRKTFKKLAALALASVMTLSSSVMASAATMKVYIREWEQGTTSNTYLGTPKPILGITNPVVTVTGVSSKGSYKDALKLAEKQGKVTLGWNKEYPEYLTSLAVKDDKDDVIYSKINKGENQNPIYDGETMTGATWVGSSWMWYPGNDLKLADTSSYPDTTLGKTQVPSSDEFSLVLSYDTTHFKWGTALEGNN